MLSSQSAEERVEVEGLAPLLSTLLPCSHLDADSVPIYIRNIREGNMDETLWFLEEEGEGGEELSDETVTWMLDNASWEDGILIPPSYRPK